MVVVGSCRVASLTMLRDSASATDVETDAPTARSTARRTSSLTSFPPPPCAKAGLVRASRKNSVVPYSAVRRMAISPVHEMEVQRASPQMPHDSRFCQEISGLIGAQASASVAETARDHRLGADAEPAERVAAQGAAEPERHEQDGDDHDEPVDQRLPHVEAGQQFGQEDQKARAQHRAQQRGQPAQDDDRDELDGEEEAELLRIQEAHDERAQRASQAGVKPAQPERDRSV